MSRRAYLERKNTSGIPQFSDRRVTQSERYTKLEYALERESDEQKDHIKFVKFLVSVGVLYSGAYTPEQLLSDALVTKALNSNLEFYSCRQFKKKGEKFEGVFLYQVTDALSDMEKYYDTDLMDDVFEHGSIVRPYDAENEKSMDAHSEKWNLAFNSTGDKKKYYKSRSKLYCQYTFLRRLAMLYRQTAIKSPFLAMLDFYNRHKKPLNLRIEAVLHADDNWTTGLHEWLMCQDFKEAFFRTAGYYEDKSACLSPIKVRWERSDRESTDFYMGEFNWLDYQFLIRTKYDCVIFRNNLEGHTGGVNKEKTPKKRNKGWVTRHKPEQGQSNFNSTLLSDMLKDSSSPAELIQKTYKFYYNYILHNETSENSYGSMRNRAGFTVTGAATDNEEQMNVFKNSRLVFPHREFKIWVRDLCIQGQIESLNAGESLAFSYEDESLLPLELIELMGMQNTESLIGKSAPSVVGMMISHSGLYQPSSELSDSLEAEKMAGIARLNMIENKLNDLEKVRDEVEDFAYERGQLEAERERLISKLNYLDNRTISQSPQTTGSEVVICVSSSSSANPESRDSTIATL